MISSKEICQLADRILNELTAFSTFNTTDVIPTSFVIVEYTKLHGIRKVKLAFEHLEELGFLRNIKGNYMTIHLIAKEKAHDCMN